LERGQRLDLPQPVLTSATDIDHEWFGPAPPAAGEPHAHARIGGRGKGPAVAVRSKKRATPSDQRIRSLIAENVRLVRHTLARVGVPDVDLDDEIQRTLIVAARRIDDVEPGAERSFLIQVARNIGAHWHRSRSRRKETPASDAALEAGVAPGTPEDTTLQKEARTALNEVLASLPEPLRCVFVSFELDELNLTQIASQLGIPRGTVASRLRRARKQVRQNITAIDLAWELDIDVLPADEPVLLRRRSLSALAHALLKAGASTSRRRSMREKTLAACLAFLSRESRRT
jgi:RNA polymerase sigma-70 factor (ECF subfamily)